MLPADVRSSACSSPHALMRRHSPESALSPSLSTGQFPAPPDSSRLRDACYIGKPRPLRALVCAVSLSAIFAFPAFVSRHSLGSNSHALRLRRSAFAARPPDAGSPNFFGAK